MTVMRPYLGSLVVVVLAIACGGTSGTSTETGGGSSAGGDASAGSNGAGASAGGTAGKTSGGSSNVAGVGGRTEGSSGSSLGGSGVTAGNGNGGSGGGVVDEHCPAMRPMGACTADDAGVACQYDSLSGCLCYPNAAGTLTPCQKVDPTCPAPAAAAAPADPGAGGGSNKIAPPAQQVCSCAASTWTCHY
jgi:hypothetical protein